MSDVLILRQHDSTLEARGRKAGLATVVTDQPSGVAFDRALLVAPGTQVPWDLVPAGLHFIERWDAAAPLWRYNVLAADAGTDDERRRTAAIVRDLRVPLHSYELLFVRGNEVGRALLATWEAETRPGDDPRLAFLRALYRVKPRFCALPCSWLAEVRERNAQDQRGSRPAPKSQRPLVKVEIRPGQFVRCYQGDEEKVRERYRLQSMTRAERRRRQEGRKP